MPARACSAVWRRRPAPPRCPRRLLRGAGSASVASAGCGLIGSDSARVATPGSDSAGVGVCSAVASASASLVAEGLRLRLRRGLGASSSGSLAASILASGSAAASGSGVNSLPAGAWAAVRLRCLRGGVDSSAGGASVSGAGEATARVLRRLTVGVGWSCSGGASAVAEAAVSASDGALLPRRRRTGALGSLAAARVLLVDASLAGASGAAASGALAGRRRRRGVGGGLGVVSTGSLFCSVNARSSGPSWRTAIERCRHSHSIAQGGGGTRHQRASAPEIAPRTYAAVVATW